MTENHFIVPDDCEKTELLLTIKFPKNLKLKKGEKLDLPKSNYIPIKLKKTNKFNTMANMSD